MNYADTKSLGYRIAEALYKNGPMPSSEIIAMFSDFKEHSVKSMIGRMCFEADLENEKGRIQVRAHIRRHFAEKYADKSDVAGVRVASTFTPLKSVPWAQHIGKLRDIGFKTSGTSFVQTV